MTPAVPDVPDVPAGPVGPAGPVDVRVLEAELTSAALDGADWHALLRHAADRCGYPARLLDMRGAVLAASDGTPAGPAAGASAVAVASVVTGLACAATRCRDGWAGWGGPVRMGNRYVGVLLLDGESTVATEASRLAGAAATAMAVVALRAEAHRAAQARGVDVVLDDIRHGVVRPAAEFVRVAEGIGLDVRIPHAGVALLASGAAESAWASGLQVVGHPVLRDGDRAWTLVSGDVRAELVRLRHRLVSAVGPGVTVFAAGGPVVVGDPVDPAETAASFRAADAVLALARSRPGETLLLFDELGMEALLLSAPPDRLSTFVEAELGGLDAETIDTLGAWLATDGSVEAVAGRTGVGLPRARRRLARLGSVVAAGDASVGRLTALYAADLARRITAASDDPIL